MLTVRDMVKAMQAEMRDAELLPEQARTYLTRFTALTGNCLHEIREAEDAYNHVLMNMLDGSGPVNRARIKAQTTPEYKRLQEAKHTHALVIESVRSLRQCLRSLSDEMRLTQ